MKVKRVLRKIASVAAGAAMLGATVTGALAVSDLGDWPAPFVVNGQWNGGYIVVGAAAKTEDVIGSNNLISALQTQAVTRVPIEGGETGAVVEGGVSLNTDTDKIYFGDEIDVARQTITGDDLSILGDRTFTDDDGNNYDYTMDIKIAPGTGDRVFTFGDSGGDLDDPEMYVDLGYSSTDVQNKPIYKMRIIFDDPINLSDTDVQGETIELFGKEYTISQDSVQGNDADGTTLVLYGGAEEVTINAQEEMTITFQGEEYTIKVIGITGEQTPRATISVTKDGVTETKEISERSSKKINGLDIYAKTLISYAVPENTGTATLRIGANKITMKNEDEVMVGEDEEGIDGTYVTFTVSNSKLGEIDINVVANDNDYDNLNVGDEFVDPVFGTFKLDFPSVSQPFDASTREDIAIKTVGDDTLKIEFTDEKGNDASIEFAHDPDKDNTGSTLALADDDGHGIYVVEGAPVGEDNYTILNAGNDIENLDSQHFIQVTKIHVSDNGESTDDYVEFKDIITGNDYKVEFTDDDTDSDNNDFSKAKTIDGKDYTIKVLNSDSYTKVRFYDDDDTSIRVFPVLTTSKGAEIAFVDDISIDATSSDVVIQLPTGKATLKTTGHVEVDGTDYDVSGGDTIIPVGNINYLFNGDSNGDTTTGDFTVGLDTDQSDSTTTSVDLGILFLEEENDQDDVYGVVIGVDDTTKYIEVESAYYYTGSEWSNSYEDTSNDDLTKGLDYYGTLITVDNTDNDHQVVSLSYPDTQLYANLFVAPAGATATTTASGNYREVVNPIPVGVSILDTNAPDIGSAPMLVVGGPCVNTVAAELMGNPANCVEGFEPGKGIIKLFPEQDALLVAGYNAADTLAATQVLANYDQYASQLAGKTEVQVITADKTVTDVTTTTTGNR